MAPPRTLGVVCVGGVEARKGVAEVPDLRLSGGPADGVQPHAVLEGQRARRELERRVRGGEKDRRIRARMKT